MWKLSHHPPLNRPIFGWIVGEHPPAAAAEQARRTRDSFLRPLRPTRVPSEPQCCAALRCGEVVMPPGKTLKDLEKQWFPEDKDLEIVASPNVKNR